MADLADVERALVGRVAAALFPGASYQPGAYLATASGQVAKVVRGWPLQDALLTDLAAGRAVVSVFSDPGLTRNVSRWFPAPMQGSAIAPAITASVSPPGSTVTLAGTVTAGNVVGVRAGRRVPMPTSWRRPTRWRRPRRASRPRCRAPRQAAPRSPCPRRPT